jgi:hypothetical protein
LIRAFAIRNCEYEEMGKRNVLNAIQDKQLRFYSIGWTATPGRRESMNIEYWSRRNKLGTDGLKRFIAIQRITGTA